MLRKGMFISDRYEIIDRVGSGGMSDVYKALCHKLNRYVAIKVLKQEFSQDKNFVSKFRVEAQSAAGLSHPNIVNVYDVGEDNGIYYIVMELIDGITLKNYIERKGHLPVKEAVSIAIQVAQGIEAAHNNHIIHRDIKPQNIIISKEGKVKVTDFGIARAASTNTISSNAMGSVHYISPEQAKGGFIDEKSDIYSLGITLFEMITGTVPFEGDSTVSIALQHVQNEIPSLREYVDDLPISVEKIVMKCTQKKPDRRYLKVGSLIADLKKSLIYPDEDFVQMVSLDDTAPTVMISDDEVSQIRKESGFEKPELDIPIIDEDNDLEFDDDDAEEDVDDDLELGEENPKIDKIIAIGGIVSGIVILLAIIFIIISFTGGGCSGGSKKNDSSKTTEDTSLDADHTVVPNVVGMKEEDASKELNDAELGCKSEQEYSDTVDEGCVISQSVDSDSVVTKHTTIIIKVSKGKEGFEVPDVTGKDKDEAKEILEEAGLDVTVKMEASDSVEINKVTRTDPEASTQVAAKDKITVYISSGPSNTQVSVPNLIGKDQDEAKAALDAAGLLIGKVDHKNSDEDKGKVISQGYEANTAVDKKTKVDIVVSDGPVANPSVPNLSGISVNDAKKALENVGLKLGEASSSDYHDTIPEGYIISFDKAGDTVQIGSKINYKVSMGKEQEKEKKYTVYGTIEKKDIESTSDKTKGCKYAIIVNYNTSEQETVKTGSIYAYDSLEKQDIEESFTKTGKCDNACIEVYDPNDDKKVIFKKSLVFK